MSILDTFYILFKNNSDEVIKANKEIDKSSQGTAENLKKANEQAENLGQSFVKMVEGAAQAGAAILSFGAIKAGVLDQAKFNSNLEVQGRLLGQNVTDIKAYGAAFEAAGGSVAGFQNIYRGAVNAAINAGLPIPSADTFIRNARSAVAGLPRSSALFRLNQLGISGNDASLFLQSNAEFEKSIAAGREHAAITEKDTAAARDFEAAWSKLGQSMDALFSKIGTDVLPVFTSLAKTFTDFTDSLQNNKTLMYEFFGGMIALSITAAGAVGRLAASLIALRGGVGALAAISSRLGIAGAVTVGLPLVANGAYAGGQYIGHAINRFLGRGDANGVIQSGNAQDAVAFWMSQGFTREQAAGIAANEQRESNFNAGARGDGGSAVGLYQWHPDRVRKILAATGIDVRTASADDQRRAAAWELKNTGIGDDIRGTNSPDAAASLFSRAFERPANGTQEAILRGQMALGIASSTPFSGGSGGGGSSSKSTSIKIDEINVHTQATDAAGISGAIGDELSSHLRTTVSNFDDGIGY